MYYASRFVTGYGTFKERTSQNAIAVLEQVIKEYDKLVIIIDHGAQFLCKCIEAKVKGTLQYEKD